MIFLYALMGILMLLTFMAQDPTGKNIFRALFVAVLVVNVGYVLEIL